MRALLCAVAATAMSLATSTSFANNGGLPGYTGKPTAFAPQGESCNQCHSGGTAPTVVLEGPASLAAGQSAEYQLIVSTTLGKAGAGIAATDGVVLTPVANMRDSFGEMVQNAAVTVAQGKATFRFKVTAPTSGTSLKLWAVGLAANGTAGNSGDKAAHTTREITITGGMPVPTNTPDAGSGTDSGSSAPSNTPPTGSTSGSNGSTNNGGSTNANAPTDSPDDDDPTNTSAPNNGTSRPRAFNDEAGGCATARLGRSVVETSGIFIFAVGIVALKRRRKKHG